MPSGLASDAAMPTAPSAMQLRTMSDCAMTSISPATLTSTPMSLPAASAPVCTTDQKPESPGASWVATQ